MAFPDTAEAPSNRGIPEDSKLAIGPNILARSAASTKHSVV
jgi:hypothetical protein